MSIVKSIRDNSGSGKTFEEVTTSQIVYDTTPQVGSFNPVVSDGIAKALEVATEIPVVTSETAGKVLTASWNAETSTGSTSWGEAPSGAVVIEFNGSHTYTSEECAALASQAQAATTARKPVFVCDVSGSMYPPTYALLSYTGRNASYSTEYVFVQTTASTTASPYNVSGISQNGAVYRLSSSSFTRESANVRSLPSTVDVAGKVLSTTDYNGTLAWVDQQSLSAGDAISIEDGVVSVNVGTGLNSGSTVDMALKAIKRDGKYYSIGQLTAQAVAAIKDNASLDVTVLGDYTIEPNLYSFNDVRISIAPAVDGGRLPDVSAAKAILSTTNIRSSFVAGSGAGLYTMPANTQVAVDFSNPTIGSSISWADVEENPTNYLLVIVGFYYGTLYAGAYSNASAQDPEQKDVATVGYTDNSLQVSNPVPSYTTSEDGKVLGVVDNSGTAELQWVSAGGSSYTAGNGIAINGSELSVRAGAGLKFSSGTSIDKKGASRSYEPWNGQFAGIRVSPWMLVTEGNTQKLRFYCSEHEMEEYIGYSGATDSLSTSAKVAIFKYDGDQDAYIFEAESQLAAGKLVPRYSDASSSYAYILGTAQGDPDGGIYLVEFTLGAAVDPTDGYGHTAFFLTDADTGTAQLSGEGIDGLYGMNVPSSVASSMGDALITPGEMSVDTTSTYDTSSKKPATCSAIASAIAQIPGGGGAEYTEDDGEITLGESCDSSGVVVTSQGPLSISKSGGLMGYGKITTNCLIKENGSLVDKVKVTFNNGLAEAVGTVIASGTSAGDTYMTIAVPVFGVYNFSATLDNIFMEITLTGAESGHTYSYDDSGYSDDHIRKVEMYWI